MADTGTMTLSPADAMSLLFNRPDVELELDGGGILRIHLISLEGERVPVGGVYIVKSASPPELWDRIGEAIR
jgi:hypothetical protein